MKQDRGYQSEEQIIAEARKRADAIIKEAEEVARIIYASSLEYVDDMLAEVELVALRTKENMRLQSEMMLQEFDSRIDMIGLHKQELLEMLQELSSDGQRPMKKASYSIKIDDSYMPRKQSYEVRSHDARGENVEVHKPVKAAYEIKIADEWKSRVDEMLAAAEEPLQDEPRLPELEEEEEEGFKASDFDLDGEYFSWLEENKK